MAGYGWIGALIQRGQQWADKGVGWAIYNKQRNQYASQVRHLRRREYQDMMFSMKQAGLNPILAAGATPGHSAAYMGRGIDEGSGAPDGAQAVNQGMSAMAAKSQADTAEATGQTTRDLNKELAAKAVEEAGAQAAARRKYEQDVQESKQRTLREAAQTALAEQEAIRAGASAKELDARRRQIELEMQGRIGGNFTQDPIGYIGNTGRRFYEAAQETKSWLESPAGKEFLKRFNQMGGGTGMYVPEGRR